MVVLSGLGVVRCYGRPETPEEVKVTFCPMEYWALFGGVIGFMASAYGQAGSQNSGS